MHLRLVLSLLVHRATCFSLKNGRLDYRSSVAASGKLDYGTGVAPQFVKEHLEIEESISRFRMDYMKIPKHSISLAGLFQKYGVDPLLEFGMKVQYHPQSKEIITSSKAWAESYNAWIPENGMAYSTMAPAIYSIGDSSKVATAGKIMALNFYLDDICDVSTDEQTTKANSDLIGRLQLVCEGHHPCGLAAAGDAEFALFDVFQTMHRQGCSDRLFSKIRIRLAQHLGQVGLHVRIPNMAFEEYINFRRTDSGMPHSVNFGEFCCLESELDHDYYEELGISEQLLELEVGLCDFGCLGNDVFSFEKEIVKNGCNSNLVFNIYHNEALDSVEDALAIAVKHLATEIYLFNHRLRKLLKQIEGNPKCESLRQYLDYIEKFYHACWTWQAETSRYLGANTIFSDKKHD